MKSRRPGQHGSRRRLHPAPKASCPRVTRLQVEVDPQHVELEEVEEEEETDKMEKVDPEEEIEETMIMKDPTHEMNMKEEDDEIEEEIEEMTSSIMDTREEVVKADEDDEGVTMTKRDK